MTDYAEELQESSESYRYALRALERERANREQLIRTAHFVGHLTPREIIDATEMESSKVYAIINDTVCSVHACGKRVKARGMCSMHYHQSRRQGG